METKSSKSSINGIRDSSQGHTNRSYYLKLTTRKLDAISSGISISRISITLVAGGPRKVY